MSFANSHAVVLDAGASTTLTPFLVDFVGNVRTLQDATMQGIGSGLTTKGIGKAQFRLKTRDGSTIATEVQSCLHVPELPAAPSHQKQVVLELPGKADSFRITKKRIQSQLDENIIDVIHDEQSNLPMIETETDPERCQHFVANLSKLGGFQTVQEDATVFTKASGKLGGAHTKSTRARLTNTMKNQDLEFQPISLKLAHLV